MRYPKDRLSRLNKPDPVYLHDTQIVTEKVAVTGDAILRTQTVHRSLLVMRLTDAWWIHVRCSYNLQAKNSGQST